MSDYGKLYFAIKKIGGAFRDLIPVQMRMVLKDRLIQKDIAEFTAKKQPYDSNNYPMGVNLIGSIRAEMGLGQSCRLAARQLQTSGLPLSVYNIDFGDKLRQEDHSWDASIRSELPYGINLFHVNLFELGNVFSSMPELWDGHYNIAFWLWELEDFPKEWVAYCSLFDEIWTPSAFTARGIQKALETSSHSSSAAGCAANNRNAAGSGGAAQVPVRVMPYCPTAPCDESCGRASFGLPEDQFLCLIMYDVNSTTGRKNPQGAIEAYRMAFPKEDPDCGLVIKINNAKEADVRRLRKELDGYRNVYFITDILKKEKVNSLIRSCDVYLSLHRSEGFGLVLAEAMLLGTPVVATNWSTNTEFMSEEAACMVDYRLIKNPKSDGPYPKGCIWADPDLGQAAEYIRRLKNDRQYHETKAANGKACIDRTLNEEKLNALWRDQIGNAVNSQKFQ